MPPNEVHQIDYMAEEGYISDFVEDVDKDENGAGDQNIDHYDMLTKLTDTSSAQARTRKDIQGIPSNKESYRRTRLEQVQKLQEHSLRKPTTPWGYPALGKRTRKKNKYIDNLILRRRSK